MRCPACGRELTRVTVEGISLDVCRRGCGGIWFDRYELMKVDEARESASEALLYIERDLALMADHEKRLSCPKDPGVVCSVKSRPGQYLVYYLAGAAAIGALTFMLPLVDTGGSSDAAYVGAYAIVIASVAPLLHGLFLAARGQSTQVLLAVGAVAAALGILFVFLSRPENGSALLILANLSKIIAAACLGISLARYVRSVGIILLIAAVAVASDLLSVFAGPTRVLVEEESPVLDLLVVWHCRS